MYTEETLVALTSDELASLSNEEKLDIIRACSTKLYGGVPDPSHDHRQFLDGAELDRIIRLLQARSQRLVASEYSHA